MEENLYLWLEIVKMDSKLCCFGQNMLNKSVWSWEWVKKTWQVNERWISCQKFKMGLMTGSVVVVLIEGNVATPISDKRLNQTQKFQKMVSN